MSSLAASLARILRSKVAPEIVTEVPAIIPRNNPGPFKPAPSAPQEAVPESPLMPVVEAAPEQSINTKMEVDGVVSDITPGQIVDDIVPNQAQPEINLEINPPANAAPTPPGTVVNQSTPDIDQVQADMLDEAVSRADEANDFMATSIDDYDTSQNWMPNFDHVDSNEKSQSLVAGLADRFVDEIDESRRGIIRDEQLYDMAKELGETPEFLEKILLRQTGEPANAETIMASRHVLHGSARMLKEMSLKVLDGTADDNMKLQFHRQWDFHNHFMSQYMGARAEIGRAMRSYGMPLGSEPAQSARMNEIMDTQAGRFDIHQVALQMSKMDTFEGINTVVKGQKGGMSKTGGVVVEWFTAGILSGVKTHIVNTSGNALMTVLGPIETALAARMGWGINSPDKIQKGEALAQTFGLLNGFREALHVMFKVAKTGEPYGGISKFEQAHPKAISSANLGGGPYGFMIDALGATVRAPLERIMGPIDGFFRSVNERAKVSQLAYREANQLKDLQGLDDAEYLATLDDLLTNVPQHIQEAGVDYSLYNMAATPLGKLGQDFQSLLNKTAPGKIIMPFIRTPTNLLKMGFVERTPLGFLSRKLREDLMAGNERAQMARARMTFGSMIAATIAVYAVNGMITGSGPSDYKARNLKRATGWQPRSFVLTDDFGKKTYISYDRAEPLSYIVGTVADLVELNEANKYNAYEEQDLGQAINAVSLVLAENTINKTFMTNQRDMMLAIAPGTQQESRMNNFLGNMANAMVGSSGLRRDIRKFQDPYMRQTQTIMQKIKNGTPFYSETLPKTLDVMGEPILYEQILNPWPVKNESDDLVLLHLGDLLDSTGVTPLLMPKKSIKNIKLSVYEYHDVTELSRQILTDPSTGLNFRMTLLNVIRSPVYQAAATDFLRVEAIQTVARNFDAAARKYMLMPENSEYAELQARVQERIIGKAQQKYGAKEVEEALKGQIGF